MKLKQFIFALVAMLSFSFSSFAQTTVSSQADLETALQNGGEVTLGASITVSAPVTIPSSSEVVLNLNGKTLKATNAKTKVLENQGKLTINGQGTVSGIIYNGTANGSAAEMTLNGGTYSLDGNNGGLHHYGKTLTINDGVVVKTTSYGVRMAGKNSVLNLNGGTYTSTGTGDMARPLALSNGTVNFLDSDITVNGHMHVMVGQVTVNFGENNQYSPFEAYHQGNSYASSVFYCKTLTEAISRTGFAAVTLVKNVKVAADAPITVNKNIDLNLNGKNLSATNAKTTVLKNYANMTINGKGTVTGLVYNGDADNKGVAEMTLNGGTYKLDGANGGFFNYGKTLTVNDGVTISSQVYGLRMSNAASVINLNGGTFTSTNPTDNMKRAIAVDAGTINFNDDDITINGYFHANRSKAKVNFGEYCPFDAFMYSTTNASGYYVVNLENAIDKADAGFEIVLQKNLERNEIVTLPKKVTLDGNGKTLTSKAGRAINVDCADVVTIENLTIAGATGCERGINIINKAGTTNLKKVNVSGVSHYAVHVATSADAAKVNIENSNLTGWAAVAAYGENGTINVKNSNLVGINNYTGTSNNFATIAAASNIAVNVTGGKVTAESFEGKGNQYIVCGDRTGNVTTGASFTLDTELELKGTAEYANIDLDNNTVTVREVYGTNYVTTPAGNGLVTLTGASEAMIGDKKYSTIAQAFAAAKEGETITLIADVAPMLVSQSAITKAAVIDLNGKRLTLNNADLYFGTTTFKNGTIVVAPSVFASTAVFWMFENQALAFDNVDIVATGVTGTYLIGINGGTGTTVDIINGSSITIDNESKANLTAVICDNGTGNTVTIKDSDIDVKNIEGRFYLGGKNGAVVVENTDADLNGVKEGFYLRAGQSLDIAGTSNVNVVLNSTEGRYGINVTDATAKYNKAETAEVNATVFEKKGGNNFNGYTSADGIWGETWGNAKESFVIKVLDANGNVMGTTSLNNIGGIINGNVNVSWNLKFDAASNTDEYWTMAWTTAPSISNMPAKVELWVDGVEVSGGDVVLNGPDDLNKIVAAVTDADGKIISCHTSVALAAATNATNIALLRDTNEEIILPAGVKLNTNGFTAANVKTAVAAIGTQKFASLDAAIKAAKASDTVTVFEGTYALPSMKAGITIVGEGNVLFEGTLTGTLENLTMKNIHIKGGNAQRWAYAKGNLVFENVIFEATSVYALHFDGITEGATLTYKNCTIIGWAAMSGSPASCVFEGCTIKGNGTYGLIRTYFDAEIKDCTFDVSNVNTNDVYQDGIHAVNGAEVVVDGCTNANGDMEDLVNVGDTSEVTVDGVVYKNVAKVGDKYYATLVEAFAAVGDGAGKTVELIADVDLAGAKWTPVNFNGVFDGKDHTISNLVVNGTGKSNQGFFAQTNNGEIKNVTFHNAKVTGRLNVGVVAGTPYTSKYTNVKVTGHVEVNGMAYVGGVGGKNAYANWTDITVDVDGTSYVKATSTENGTAYRTYVGGVIGFNGEGGHTFKNISSNIKVIGDVMDIGGIFGILHYGNKAEDITFTGAVEAPAEAKEVGSIAGVWHNEKGQVVTITNADSSKGTVTVGDVTTTGSIVGGAYNANNVTPSTSGSLKVDGKEMWLSVAKIGDTTYRTLADALTAAKDGETVNLLWAEGEAPIAMSGAVFGKNVTIKGTATVDWSKGWLYVGRGGEGNATVTFDGANLTSASDNASYGIHVSGREKGTNNKYDGTVVIKNSTIVLDFLINKGAMTLDKATLTVKNGFANGGRPAGETENGKDATATISLTNESKLVVNNHNGMGLGYEAIGVMNVDATSTFETTQSFLVTAKGTMNLAGTAKVAGTLTNNGAIVLTNEAATLTSNECGNVTTSVPDQVVSYIDGKYTLVAAVAKIGDALYTSLQAAIDAVKNGGTITLIADVAENVTLTEKAGVYYTIDGAGKTMNGTITVKALSDTEDNRRITIKNINFVADAKCDFITSTETNHYPRLTVDGCSFTGTQANDCVAIRLKSSHSVVIKNCTGKNLHSFLQNTSGWNLTIDGVTVTDSKSGLALGTVQGVTVQNCNITASEVGYGIRLDANTYNNNAVIAGNKVSAFIPVVVRELNANGNITIGEGNEFTAANTDGKWMVIGKEEYETNGALPAEVAGANVVVALNDANLSYTGIHGAGLAGEGTAEKPYLINNVAELEIFRNSVNAGSAKYSKPGLCVALNADIDMAGVNWVGIGSATKDHGFMGNFDGKNFKIKNLTITNPALDSDGYAYAGLFGVTEGTDKDNQNTIKNLTIENVTINTTGHIAAAAIAYPYYTIVDNVKVCGDIKIQGGDYTAGVLAYTRRCVNASNLSIDGNDGSYVKGNQAVGGVISDIQTNGGLVVDYKNFTAEGITVKGEKQVGGISGIIAAQTLNGATVKNVTLESQDNLAGVVAGRLGAPSTVVNVVTENVTGATALIGGGYSTAKAVEARIGDTYYTAFADAYTAAKAGETVTMLVDLTMSEILVLDKAITLDGNGKTLTSTAARAINVDGADGATIKNLTINASGERAINVINGATNVTIDNVTATAANYTVNLAGSAANAVVVVKNSNLTGLNVVNVAAAGSNVTISGGTITCNDNNANENYAALTMNKDAVGAEIAANGVTFYINGDSKKASNQAEGGIITIDGSTDEVEQHVAYISYGNNWYGFATIEAAIAKAEAGETVTLLRDITASAIITIDKAITLDGNGKTLTSTAGRAINVDCDGNVGIKNLTINAKGERAINVIQKPAKVTIEGVTATAANYTVNLASSAGAAKVAINNSTLNGLCTVNVSAAGANVTVDNSTVNCNDNNTTAGEAYAALCLNKEAVGGSIVATNTTVNVAAGSDSMKGRNSAENGTVTINGSTDGVAVMVAVITYPGSDYYHSFATLASAIEFAKAGDVVTLIRDVTISYGARDLLATAAADKAVTIDGKGHTLTLNQTNSDWASIGLENNNKLVLKNMTINKAGKGATSGAWNTHAIIFSTNVEMENVIVNNSVAVQAGATLNNVTINEAGEYYGLWINGNGQTVTVNGGAINATTNGGRGIKIADQYIDAPAKVTLSVDGTVFSTAKKAAVLVSSKAGAEITASNVNIENVVADNVNFVWVDGDWAQHFGNVTVNGAPAVMEDAASFVAAVTVNGAVKAYYATIAKAIEAVQDGEEVALVADITASEVILLGKSLTINGNGHKVTSSATRVFRATTANTEVTLNNVNMVSTAVRVGSNDIRGISIDNVQNVKLTLNNCSVDFTDASANDWTYAVNVTGGNEHTVTVIGGTYEGANVINVNGASNTVVVKDAVLTSLYPANDAYYGACIYVVQNNESSVVATGNTLNGSNAIAFNVGYTPIEESENVDKTEVYVAKVGTVYYHSVNEAINAAENGATVQLLKRRIDEAIAPWTGDSQHKLEKSITIQGYSDFGTRLTGGMFLGYNDGTVRENTITVKGINFVGKGVVVANQKNVVIEGNKFTGINALVSDKHANSNCAVLVIGTSKDMSIAATVKNNVIENVANAGIYLSQVAKVVVEDNTVTGTKHNALTVSAATTATVDVKNNTFAQWGLGGEGRAMRISGAATVNVNENVMSYEGTMPEEFVKVTGATAFNASANYWNGESLLTEGLLAGVDPLTVASSYYTDAEKQNLVELTATKSVAKVGKTYYVTFAEAFNVAAQNGEEVTILAGEYTGGLTIDKAITVKGETDADGKNLVKFNGKLNITANGAAVKNIDVKNSGTAAYINAADVLVENCNLEGSNGLYQSYAKGTVTFKNSVITGATYGVHFDGSTGGNIVIENCTITGWTSFAGTIANVAISKTTFADGNYNQLRFYQNAQLTDCTFNEKMTVDFGKNEVEAEFTGCTVENGGDLTDVIYLGDIADMGVKVTIDGKPVCVQAKVDGNYYQTILEAVEAAKNGETVTVLTDIALDTKTLVTECDGYSSIVNVEGKAITIDLNGKTITVDAAAADLANAKGNMLMAVFSVDEGGKLTIDDSSDDKTGVVNVSANGATVYSLAAAYGEGAQLTINNGSYYVDEMPEATSLIYAQRSECVIINGGTYNIGNVGTLKNGSPWIFNTKGQNVDGIYVYGGTYPTDINHQFWFNEAIVPGHLAVKANEDGTLWSVVEAAAYTREVGRSTGSWRRDVGYATIEEAIAATQTRFCEDKVVTLAKNVEIEQMITVANGVEVTLDLNGMTLAATDNTSKNYSAIDNRGELTIVDSSEDETGKITVTATVNSGWNRYSAVIANNPGGELTVMSGTIEHLGGTDMAYGIDNLTNGKGTHAVTEIYGGTVKSPYRAVRQFLNGVEANNTLAVYGGTLEGANKSIWMQDPSKNANTGNLYVGEEAVLNGDVYLTVTAGSTEWPVEAYIEKAALAEGKNVLVSNVPADAAALVEYDTFWQVEQKNLAELTIVDEDYTEYINKIEKNVAELTYVRDFTGEWETIYLPFGFTITEDMAKEFEFAYIYNASYKGKQATFEFVEVGVGFNLAANYPYLVKAREAGENEIVVENAKLMPTKVETIDCSSIFEKFSFIGNYATVDADNLDDTMGYFSLNGAWSKMDVVNPFRFYMQIQLRNGDAFEYPSEAQPIRMRSVNANGEETTGINGVDAEQADDFIFDIHGRRVLETEKGGIYIKGGKKFIAQ